MLLVQKNDAYSFFTDPPCILKSILGALLVERLVRRAQAVGVAAPCIHRLLVLGSWVGARRPFHLSLLLPASRMVLPQDPSTE